MNNCKDCVWRVEVKNPETGEIKLYMCSNKDVKSRLFDKTFKKETCDYKEEE